MKNKEHFKRRTIEFLLKSCGGDQNIYINLRGDENFIKYMKMSSITPSPTVINDPSLSEGWNNSTKLYWFLRKTMEHESYMKYY